MRSPLDEFRGGSYSARERRRGPSWAPSPLRMRGLAGDRAHRIAGGLGARPSVLVLLILLLRLLRHALAEGVLAVLVGAVQRSEVVLARRLAQRLTELRRVLLVLLRRPVVAERSGRKRQRDGGRRGDCNSLGHA